jgi:hypothetical protein
MQMSHLTPTWTVIEAGQSGIQGRHQALGSVDMS